jgi:ELWxxDGT repeat protein
VNGTLYFRTSDDGSGSELWKSDGTETGTVRLKDIRPGTDSSFPGALTNVSGTLYFWANDGNTGTELWKTDGTEAGTVRVKDIRPGANPSLSFFASLTNVGGTLYFTANDGTNGYELWKSDGTETGTVLVEDLTGDSYGASPREITVANDRLFVTAGNEAFGTEMWVGTLGTRQGDFDRNGLLELADIDALVAAIVSNTHPRPFDVTNDNRVTGQDLNLWLQLAGSANLGPGRVYLPGDANLDAVVDQFDFEIWNTNKFIVAAAWSRGDFNADGVVDGSDFGIWNSNKFTVSDGRSRVRKADSHVQPEFSDVLTRVSRTIS